MRPVFRLVFALAVATVNLLAPMSQQPARAAPTTDPRVADLVKAGGMRVALNLGNGLLASKDKATGELRGAAVDLGRALAVRIGVPFVPVEYPTPPKILEGLKTGAWDVTFLAIDPARAGDVDFSPPYMEVGQTYLVPAGSPIHKVADADQPGVRISVRLGFATDLFLTGSLQHATLVRTDTDDEAIDLLRTGKVDAYASSRGGALAAAAKVPSSRVLEDNFTTAHHAMAVPKGQLGRLAYISEFIEQAKATGLAQQAITNTDVPGIPVAPPADPTPGQEGLALFDRFFLAQNAHDLGAVGELLLDSPHFLWISRGASLWGREAALQQFSTLYQGTWQLAPDMADFQVTLLSGDVAQLYVPIDFTTGPAGQAAQTTRFLMNQVLVKNAGKWQVESLLPIPAATP
jgi:polar amino acid transport system substrate-binding protein